MSAQPSFEESKKPRVWCRVRQWLRFLFARRLVIIPQAVRGGDGQSYHDFGKPGNVPCHVPQRWLFEWQQMPKGFRWL